MACSLTIFDAFLRRFSSPSSLSRFRFLSLLCFLSLSLPMAAAHAAEEARRMAWPLYAGYGSGTVCNGT